MGYTELKQDAGRFEKKYAESCIRDGDSEGDLGVTMIDEDLADDLAPGCCSYTADRWRAEQKEREFAKIKDLLWQCVDDFGVNGQSVCGATAADARQYFIDNYDEEYPIDMEED